MSKAQLAERLGYNSVNHCMRLLFEQVWSEKFTWEEIKRTQIITPNMLKMVEDHPSWGL